MKNSRCILPSLVVAALVPGCVSAKKSSLDREPSSETLYVSEAITTNGLFGKGIEGPGVDKSGNLYVVNFGRNGTVGIVRPGKDAELWMELPEGSVANSIRFDGNGHMYIADYKKHNVFVADTATKKLEVAYTHQKMNQPNDMAIAGDGTLYMSDPSWKRHTDGGIWMAKPGGKPQAMEKNLGTANGIDITPDEKFLYFGESKTNRIYSFRIEGDKLTDKKLFHDFGKKRGDVDIDGIRFDVAGNLYVTINGGGTIEVLAPHGGVLRSIPLLGQRPTNIAFGGPDGKTVYVTNRDGGFVESFRAEHPGREWDLLHK